MTFCLVHGLLLGAVATLSAELPEPFLEYRFNDEGTVSEATGQDPTPLTLFDSAGLPTDLHSGPGEGVSGHAEDRAFDNRGAVAMGDVAGGSASTVHIDLPEMLSFTLTGWFRTAGEEPINNNAWLFQLGAGFGDPARARGLLVRSANEGRLFIRVGTLEGDFQRTSADPGFAATQEWTFFAISYDGTDPSPLMENLKFYVGSEVDPVRLVDATVQVGGAVRESRNQGVRIGNSAAEGGNNPFHGLLDNIRLFLSIADEEGSLDVEDLERLRQADLELPTP